MTETEQHEHGTTPVATMTELPIDEIRPYWRNPRNISPAAVTKLAESITRFGYHQPIVVDRDHVIIVGHTRYAALRQLGWTSVPVVVSNLDERRAKEYRVVDNRTNDYTSWNPDELVLELRQFQPEIQETFFPDVDLSEQFESMTAAVTAAEATRAAEKVGARKGTEPDPVESLTCPHCLKDFEVFVFRSGYSRQVKKDGWLPLSPLFGTAIPAEAMKVVQRAVSELMQDAELPEDQAWRALELMAADYLAGAGSDPARLRE